MKFQVLSHAGLRVDAKEKTLLVDPWLLGSCYWRSWWNYPPVDKGLFESLVPDFIYLTHIHWDHFHGPSLRKFDKKTPLLVPKGHYNRIRRDLEDMGYRNVIELKHGETFKIAEGFNLQSYSFFPFLDSGVVISADNTVLFDANDAKFMGWPLKQILNDYPKIDFVFRSHSSANGRLCYDVIGETQPPDNMEEYVKSFVDFVKATKARYAIPFASNHCFLHKEVFSLNHTVQTPIAVKDYFNQNRISSPQLQIMVSGDSWSAAEGFQISDKAERFFSQRDTQLLAYQQQNIEKLNDFYSMEARAKPNLTLAKKYFNKLSLALPWFLKVFFRKKSFVFVLNSGGVKNRILVNLSSGHVDRLDDQSLQQVAHPLEIHTSAFIFNQCTGLALFTHLPISKRVRFVVSKKSKKYIQLMNLVFLLYEYEFLPISKNFRLESLKHWFSRWREVVLYFLIALDLALGRGFKQSRYLKM